MNAFENMDRARVGIVSDQSIFPTEKFRRLRQLQKGYADLGFSDKLLNLEVKDFRRRSTAGIKGRKRHG